MSDVVRRCRRRLMVVQAGAAVGGIAALAWAVWPLPPKAKLDAQFLASPHEATVAGAAAPEHERPFDIGPFSTVIWRAEGTAAAAPPPPPPPEPAPVIRRPNVELVGIVRVRAPAAGSPDETSLLAALYDRDADEMLLLSLGERVGSFTIAAITPEHVELRHASSQPPAGRPRASFRITLADDQAGHADARSSTP